jgi:hypothetical protein
LPVTPNFSVLFGLYLLNESRINMTLGRIYEQFQGEYNFCSHPPNVTRHTLLDYGIMEGYEPKMEAYFFFKIDSLYKVFFS